MLERVRCVSLSFALITLLSALKYRSNHPLFGITALSLEVVNGLIASGRVHAGDSILFGPDSNGAYQNSVVKSIQRKRSPVGSAEAGQCVSLALKRVRRAAIRKGMVIVHKSETPPTGEPCDTCHVILHFAKLYVDLSFIGY